MSDDIHGGYSCVRKSQRERLIEQARRDWDRHPEIRSEHGGSWERYLRSVLHNDGITNVQF